MLKRLLIFLALSILLSACTRQTTFETITFSSWGSITETKIINKLINDFEKQNPDIKVNFIHIPQNYFQKIHLLFASSTPPDVIFINNLYLPVYVNQLMELDTIIDKQDFFSQSIEALSINNKLYAVPRDISNLVFYYNKNIVGELNSNWTFEDFNCIIQKPQKANVWNLSYERDIYLASPYITTLGFEKGIQFYKDIEGKVTPKPSDIGSLTLAQMFINEQIGLYLSGRWMYPKIKESVKFPYGIITFPGITNSDASGWAISKNTKHKDASVRFIKFLSSKENIDYFTETGLIIPARIDSSKSIKETEFLKAIEKSKANNVDKNYNKYRDNLNKFIWK